LIKIGLFIGLIILILVIVSIYRETAKKNQIETEISKLKEEAQQVAKANSSIQEKIDYFQSADYMEKEAKDKLNLKSPDEQVVVVKPSMAKETPIVQASGPDNNNEPKVAIANHLKWWNYFFKY